MLVNDDFTPRDFVVAALKAEFGMGEERAYKVMIMAPVYQRDIAEGQSGDRPRPQIRLSADVHDRTGGVRGGMPAGRTPRAPLLPFPSTYSRCALVNAGKGFLPRKGGDRARLCPGLKLLACGSSLPGPYRPGLPVLPGLRARAFCSAGSS